MTQIEQAVDYEAAAKALAFERAPALRPEAFPGVHPNVAGGPVVRISRYESENSTADVYTIETKYEGGGTESQVAWSLWAFDPAPGQEPSRKTRLLRELELKIGDHLIAAYHGLKPFSDGSGKTFHAFEFQRVEATDVVDDEVPPDPELGEVPV